MVLLDPAESPGIDVVGIKANETDRLGGMVLYFYWQVIMSQLFLHGELESACKDFPTCVLGFASSLYSILRYILQLLTFSLRFFLLDSAEIVGYIPNGTIGGILDFNEPAIDKMMAKGVYDATSSGRPIDLCAAYGLSRGKVPAYEWKFLALVFGIGVGIGIVVTAIISWRIAVGDCRGQRDGEGGRALCADCCNGGPIRRTSDIAFVRM